jgi:hypothetical protein
MLSIATPQSPIGSRKLNVRDQPDEKVISKLQCGVEVQIYERLTNGCAQASMDNLRNGFQPKAFVPDRIAPAL